MERKTSKEINAINKSKICNYCGNEFQSKYIKAKFCNRSCFVSFFNKTRKFSKERNEKIAKTMSLPRPDRWKWRKCKKCNNLHRNRRSIFCEKCQENSISEIRRKASIGKKATIETRRKMRIAAINNIEKYRGKLKCFVGKKEKELLDLQEQKDNCKILRQYYFSNLGYIVDGYCLENNTVYEVYEPFHVKQKEQDLKRQQEITNHLNCKFEVIICN